MSWFYSPMNKRQNTKRPIGKRQVTKRRGFRETLHLCVFFKNFSFGCCGQRGHVRAPDRHFGSARTRFRSPLTRGPWKMPTRCHYDCDATPIMIFITQERTCMVTTTTHTSIASLATSTTTTTSPRREEKAQHAKETPTLRRNAAWHHDLVPCPVPMRAINNIPLCPYTDNINMLQEAPNLWPPGMHPPEGGNLSSPRFPFLVGFPSRRGLRLFRRYCRSSQ